MGISSTTAALIAAGVSAATAVGGTLYSASASADASKAAADQNRVALQAQDTAFWSRNADARTRLAAEGTAQTGAQGQQQRAFTDTQTQQQDALGQRAATLAAENQAGSQIRQEADQQQQSLLDSTNAQALAASQAAKAQGIQGAVAPAAASLEASSPLGGATGSGGEPTKQAYAARLSQAASNVRDYGQRLATVSSYTAPLTTVGDQIAKEKAGIMPAAMANQLLQSGQQIRLLPSETNYQQAGTEGVARQAKIAAELQGNLGVANTQYAGGQDTANLIQGDANTNAANRTQLAQQSAAQAKSIGDVIAGVGSIGSYAAGRYGDSLDAAINGPGASRLITSMGGVNPQFGKIL